MQSGRERPASIRELRQHYRTGQADPREEVAAALSRANSNAGKNVYLAQDEAWSRHEAEKLQRSPEDLARQLLWGIPVAIKDCFDLQGFVTTCGSRFLGGSREAANQDSAIAATLRKSGAVITGKTHLHQLAYGITGESRDFGDCLQPADSKLLTGGSSSGSAASVQEGSAMATIGTDTGGSIRVPAALCGLAGYRASITLGTANGVDMWRGGEHLAPSFDTIGWLYRDLSDGPLLGAALFGLPEIAAPRVHELRVGVPEASFLHDCDEEVLATQEQWITVLQHRGAKVERFDTGVWRDAMDIFVPLQASEAAALHPEPRAVFEPAIAERLRLGAKVSAEEIAELRERHASFRQENERRLEAFDVLLMPSSPTTKLRAGEDHARMRPKLLRYTVPVSLLGRPTVTLPSRQGGPQLVGRLAGDVELLALSAELAADALRLRMLESSS